MRGCVDFGSRRNKSCGNGSFMATRMEKDSWDFEICESDLIEGIWGNREKPCRTCWNTIVSPWIGESPELKK
jgi:hypothetical protein